MGVLMVLGSSLVSAAEESTQTLEDAALETVLVTVTPVQGTGIPLSKVPSNVQTLHATQIDADHAQTLTDLAQRHLASVSVADTEGSPFQMDLIERGFTSSPVLGTPEALAIYQNGVRVNEPFGDIVLWDLIPVFAIETLQDIPGSNPVFGLNALGGAFTLQMKDGFAAPGGSVEFDGGSFGRQRATAQNGIVLGNSALYLGATAARDDSWRQLSSSRILQGFADYLIRSDSYQFGTSLTLAWSRLNGNGANPAEDDPTAAFAVPDLQRNHVVLLQTRGNGNITDTLSIQGTAYARYVDLTIENGSASGFSQCGDTVCNDSGPVTLLDGTAVPATVPYAGITPVETTRTLGLGGSLQATVDQPIGALKNVANLGVSFDQGSTHFSNSNQLGDLIYLSPPGVTTTLDGLYLGGSDYNIRLDAVNRYYGVFFTDTLSLTSSLSLTAAARYNHAWIRLSDLFADTLNGTHSYDRVNPSVGLTYQATAALNFYASYSESNRIPTAAELSCADPTQPCKFPLSFISDPDLHQVIARTMELGARGHASSGKDFNLDWVADVYRTRNRDDILFVSSGPLLGSGYFTNAGDTQRLGAELALDGTWGKLDFYANYGFVRATFESNLAVLSANNPGADVNGDIYVQPGDRLPEVPLHTGKLGVGYNLPWRVHVGLDTVGVSSRYLRGDEANLQKPLPGYAIVNARASWQMTDSLSFFFDGENIFDHHYSSFGLYGDPSANGIFPNFSDPRFYTPGQPFGFRIGAQLRY
jgi:iron complex outermembrane recepter protein